MTTDIEHLDWEADITVDEKWPENSDLRFYGIAWTEALYYDGPDFTESLESAIYHQRFGGHFLVGIQFQFHVGDDGAITATGTMHPAENHRGNYFTITDETIMTADISIIMKSPETAQHLRELIELTP